MGLLSRFNLAMLVVFLASLAAAGALCWQVLFVTVPLAQAERTFAGVMGSLAALFAAFFLAMNLMLQWLVLGPIRRMAATADRVSTGDFSAPEFDPGRSDELGVLGNSFNRMRRSLEKAMQMIGMESRL